MPTPTASPPHTLCIDIGGTRIKKAVVDAVGAISWGPVVVDTAQPPHPGRVFPQLYDQLRSPSTGQRLEHPRYERISVGFPGVVVDGRVETAPNLDPAWVGVALASSLEHALGVPCRAANDADIQGMGAIEGTGVELVLTLGTGMGAALFVDGRLVPNLELGHHPLAHGRTYEELVGMEARRRDGLEAWDAHLELVLGTVKRIFNPRRVYLGGGHAQDLSTRLDLPRWVRVVPNEAGLWGGVHLW